MRKEYIHFFYIPDIELHTLTSLHIQIENFLKNKYRAKFVELRIFINPKITDRTPEKYKAELIYSS